MQDAIVSVVALAAAALILRGYLKRRAAQVPPKCANCALVEISANTQVPVEKREQRSH
jgi:hypothetical protein